MVEYLITTPAVVAICNRCQQVIMKAHDNGLLVAADPRPLDREGVTKALCARLAVYDAIARAPGRTYLRQRVYDPRAAFDRWPILADHACGARPYDSRAPKAPEKPPEGPCERLARRQGGRPPGCPRAALWWADTPPEDVPASCDTCDPAPY